MKKYILSFFLVTFLVFSSFAFLVNKTDAYVSVKGYFKSNGTYVAPHVRSNPNGLKYDNYGYKPSQGLYNKTYGTRGSTWDTPTYITDPSYYLGKSLYDSHSVLPSSTSLNSFPAKSISVPPNASLSYSGSEWYCNSGYKTKFDSTYNKAGCEQVIVPANASLSYSGSEWYCNSGYKSIYNNSFQKTGCEMK